MSPLPSEYEDAFAKFHDLVERIAGEGARPERPRRRTRNKRVSRKPNASRRVNQQLIDLSSRFGILKRDIAAHLQIDPSFLSQWLAKPMPPTKVQKIADAIGIKPQYFDEYVAGACVDRIMRDAELLDVLRAYLFEADDEMKERFIDRARRSLGSTMTVDFTKPLLRRGRR